MREKEPKMAFWNHRDDDMWSREEAYTTKSAGDEQEKELTKVLPFHLITSFSTEESCDVPEGCCCRLSCVSRRSGFCNRSSLIEPSCGANLLLYLRFNDVTGPRHLGDSLCVLSIGCLWVRIRSPSLKGLAATLFFLLLTC